jgi:hypothetical protein
MYTLMNKGLRQCGLAKYSNSPGNSYRRLGGGLSG